MKAYRDFRDYWSSIKSTMRVNYNPSEYVLAENMACRAWEVATESLEIAHEAIVTDNSETLKNALNEIGKLKEDNVKLKEEILNTTKELGLAENEVRQLKRELESLSSSL